jgi:beta-glucosidase
MKHHKSLYKKLLLAALGLASLRATAQNTPLPPPDAKMQQFVSALLQKMTLEEKIGQLNLVSVGFTVTGPVVSEGVDAKIAKGLVGGVLNTFTPVAARKLQEMAVTQTRLHIPLLMGFDVIHGHRTGYTRRWWISPATHAGAAWPRARAKTPT